MVDLLLYPFGTLAEDDDDCDDAAAVDSKVRFFALELGRFTFPWVLGFLFFFAYGLLMRTILWAKSLTPVNSFFHLDEQSSSIGSLLLDLVGFGMCF